MMPGEIPTECSPFFIEVIEAGDCPVNYNKGDRLRVAYPAITPPTDKQICFAAMINAKEAFLAYLATKTPTTFECSACSNNKTKFKIIEAPHSNTLHKQIAEQLKNFSLFRLIKNTELQSIAHEIHLKKASDGEIILDIGATGEFFYIIHTGKVNIYGSDKRSLDKFNLITSLGPEDCFGEMSLLTGEPCSTRVIANGNTTILTLYKDAFQRMIQENQAINKYFFRLLANRLKNTNDKVSQQNLVNGITGSLNTLSLVEIVQIFKSSASTGVLHLKIAQDVGRIEIQSGEIHSIKYKSLENEQAFFALIIEKDGEFQFESHKGPFEKKVKIPTTGLLMESMRVIDEASKTKLD